MFSVHLVTKNSRNWALMIVSPYIFPISNPPDQLPDKLLNSWDSQVFQVIADCYTNLFFGFILCNIAVAQIIKNCSESTN